MAKGALYMMNEWVPTFVNVGYHDGCSCSNRHLILSWPKQAALK